MCSYVKEWRWYFRQTAGLQEHFSAVLVKMEGGWALTLTLRETFQDKEMRKGGWWRRRTGLHPPSRHGEWDTLNVHEEVTDASMRHFRHKDLFVLQPEASDIKTAVSSWNRRQNKTQNVCHGVSLRHAQSSSSVCLCLCSTRRDVSRWTTHTYLDLRLYLQLQDTDTSPPHLYFAFFLDILSSLYPPCCVTE